MTKVSLKYCGCLDVLHISIPNTLNRTIKGVYDTIHTFLVYRKIIAKCFKLNTRKKYRFYLGKIKVGELPDVIQRSY